MFKNLIQHASIVLKESTTSLEAVQILGKAIQTSVAGRTKSSNFITYSFNDKHTSQVNLRAEMAMKIELKDYPEQLKDLNFFIANNNVAYLKFRINVYALNDGLPDQSLLSEEIYLEARNTSWTWLKKDIEEYQIYIQEPFVVSLQIIEASQGLQEDPVILVLGSVTPFHSAYFRYGSEDYWRKAKGQLSFFATVLAE